MRWVVYAGGRPIARGVVEQGADCEVAAIEVLGEYAVATGLSGPDLRALTCVVTGPDGDTIADGRDW